MGFEHLIFGADPARLTDAVQALDQFNCIQVKQAVDPDFLHREYDTISAISRRHGSSTPPYQHMYRSIYGSSPPDFALLKLIQTEPLYSILAAHLGSSDLVVSTHYASALREVKSVPVNEVVDPYAHSAEPFHQDSRCNNPTIFGKMVIVWLLMSPGKSGVDVAPSLKLVPGPVRDILPIEDKPAHPWNQDLEISHERIGQLSAESGVWIPDVEIGDAVVFSGMCPHGTYVPGAGPTRFSCEIKVWANIPSIHDDFFSDLANHPGHMVVNKKFIVGPTAIDGINESRIANTPVDLSSGKSDYYKIAFSFGRIADGGAYDVTNSARGQAHSERADKSMVILDRHDHAADQFIQLLGHTQIDRSLVHVRRTVSPADIHRSRDIVHAPSAQGFSDSSANDVSFVTFLRDPAQRVLGDIFKKFGRLTWAEIDAYIDSQETLSVLPGLFAQITRRGNDPNGSSERAPSADGRQATLSAALQNIDTFFPLVCIEERLADSAFLLFDRFGWPRISLPDTVPLRDEHTTQTDMPEKLQAKIAAKLQDDRDIYEFCVRRLDDSLAAADFGDGLKAFRKDLANLTKVLRRTQATLASRVSEIPRENAQAKLGALQQRVRSLDMLSAARQQEIEQLQQKIERMEASYTALLKQHLEALNIPTS